MIYTILLFCFIVLLFFSIWIIYVKYQARIKEKNRMNELAKRIMTEYFTALGSPIAEHLVSVIFQLEPEMKKGVMTRVIVKYMDYLEVNDPEKLDKLIDEMEPGATIIRNI